MAFTPLHRALGSSLDVSRHTSWRMPSERTWPETDDLEWKTDLPDPRDPSKTHELAKDVAAMANAGGGLLVYGVAEDGRQHADHIIGIAAPAVRDTAHPPSPRTTRPAPRSPRSSSRPR